MAMMYYASPRMTRDIDIVIALQPNDFARFLQAFSNGYYVAPEAVRASIQAGSMFNLIHNETIIKIDFIVRKNAPYREIEFERRRRVSIEGFQTWIVNKEDLIISKLDWARDSESELQLRDVKNLVATGCDILYIDQWTQELGLDTLWQRIKP
jgi:hypothetical protein